MKLKNIVRAFYYQLPFKRLMKNVLSGRILALISKRSHYRDTGETKISFSTYKKAEKASIRMERKRGYHFSIYKCLYCDGFHIGANRYGMRQENRIEE